MRVSASAVAPPVVGPRWEDRWGGADRGLVVVWLRGREMAAERPELVDLMRSGALPMLPWKGGVAKAIRAEKLGALHYLAARAGILGEDLDLDLTQEYVLWCAATGVRVRYTADTKKLLATPNEEGDDGVE